MGKLDVASGEFWMESPWESKGNNLSAFERNRILLNTRDGSFVDVSHLTKADLDSDSRSVVAGDFNHDGMEDLIVRNTGGGPLFVFENRFPKKHWLRVSLRGVRSNSLGIGAKLKLEAGPHTLWRELYPGNTFLSQMPSQVCFGLGDATRVDRLTIFWPSGEHQVLEALPVDAHVRVTEGEDSPQRIAPGKGPLADASRVSP